MAKLENSLLVCEIKDLGFGYLILNDLARLGCEIIEGSYMIPGKFVIILKGDATNVGQAHEVLLEKTRQRPGSLLDSAVLGGDPTVVLSAFYALTTSTVNESLCVVESSTLSTLLLAAQAAVAHSKIDLLEIRSNRSIGDRSLLFFSGALSEVKKGIAVINSMEKTAKLQITLIDRPAPEFLSYFG